MTHCNHVEQILHEKDLIVKYNNIKTMINSNLNFKERIWYTKRCQTCGMINNGITYLCLNCSFTGCWNDQHFQRHFQEIGHHFGVNSNNGLLFCFQCMDYIGDNELINNSQYWENWDQIENETHVSDQIRRDGLYGIINMGSTCFMSSVLQSLIHNKYIINDFLLQNHTNSCKLKNPSDCMSCALDQIIAECYGSISKVNSHNGFLALLNCSWKINQNFAGYSQQDAHEFLQFINNQLHTDYIKVNNIDKSKKLCNCLIHSTFQGSLKSSIVCPECGDNSKTIIDPFMDLSLDIKNKETLYDCLDSFHKKEQLHDFNYHCPQCKTSQDPIKQLTINKCSPMLVLQLKRFEHLLNGNTVKLNEFIKYPLYLQLGKYCIDNDNTDNSPNILYELTGTISHIGTVNEGHYTATLKLGNSQWFKFNDSMITALNEEQALQEQAYLLIYSIKQYD